MSMTKLPCEIECPECSWRSWCSTEDPDAGFSAMWNHVRRHAEQRGGSAAEAQMLTKGLMAKVTVAES